MRVWMFLPVAVVAALALLAAACGGGEQGATPTPTVTARTEDGGELTGEQIIELALGSLEAVPDNDPDPSTATATRMKDCETVDALRWEGQQWGGTPDYPSENPVWLVKVRGEFSGFIGFGLTPDPSPPRSGTFIQILELDGSPSAGTIGFDAREQEGHELSPEDIIKRVLYEIEPMEDQPDLSAATATPMTEREALEALEREGGAPDLSMRVLTDEPAWLVEVRGEGIDSCTLAPLQGRYLSVRYADGSPVSSGFIPDAAATPGPAVELTQEQAIERALELLAAFLNNQPDPSTATATRMTYGEALETVQREGAPPDGASGLAADLPVWLVEIRGVFVRTGGPPAAGRYVFILNLRGASEYEELILDATATP